MSKTGQGVIALIGAIITLAIISVIISRKSAAPQAIQALSSGLANVVNAAVSPKYAQTNGNLGSSSYSTPSIGGGLPSLSEMWQDVTH